MPLKLKNFEMPKKVECDDKVSSSTFGKFTIEPFERGFGTTIGNALRRVMLSSLEGTAVKAVKIKNILHEFSTIKDVKEDIVEVVLNLKQLIVKSSNDSSKVLTVKAKGSKDVKASNIKVSSGVEIINPNLHIATLGKSGTLDMEIHIGKGRGYVTAEENKEEKQPVDLINFDSFFSPVKRVSYTVEDARVGQRTNYDRLILEVWTNGTISPYDAIVSAAEVINEHLMLFIAPEKIKTEEVEQVSEEEKKRDKYLEQNINELELSVRASNCLKAANIKTIGELVRKTEAQMLKYRNFGKKSLNEIKDILTKMGLDFKNKSEVSNDSKEEKSKTKKKK
ncbi:DNA-directed RNA polymerase subunit alpha [bacterium]|nr:DNA-directed RNA polymerase subunit alpha [bacterium]